MAMAIFVTKQNADLTEGFWQGIGWGFALLLFLLIIKVVL